MGLALRGVLRQLSERALTVVHMCGCCRRWRLWCQLHIDHRIPAAGSGAGGEEGGQGHRR